MPHFRPNPAPSSHKAVFWNFLYLPDVFRVLQIINPCFMKILIACRIHPLFIRQMETLGHNCFRHSLNNSGDLIGKWAGFEGVVINSRFSLDEKMIRDAAGLRFVARVGAGMENIDTAALENAGIRWFNSPEANRQAVGEHTLGMLLGLMNKLNKADREIRSGLWLREENRGMELRGRNVAIIGYGNMGSAFAQCLSGLGARVIAYDKYKKGYGCSIVEELSLEQLMQQADVVSIHVPLTDETTYMVNKDFIHAFSRNIIILNTARGKILKTQHLAEALKSGKVIAAGLDVHEYESPSFEQTGFDDLPGDFRYLMKADNVILTPHIAGWSAESDLKHAEVLAGKIAGAFG